MTRKNGSTPPVEDKLAPREEKRKRPAELAIVEADLETEELLDASAENLGQQAKRLVRTAFLRILRSIARKSVEGSLAHAKYLFEIGGIKEEIRRELDAEGNSEPSLADLLIAEMRRQHASDASSGDETNMGCNAVADAIDETDGDCGARGE